MERDQLDFQQIYTAYRPKMLFYLSRLVGEADAEDLVQEMFVKVERSLPGFRGQSSLATWLYRIATHTAYDHLRSPEACRETPLETELDEIAGCDLYTRIEEPPIDQQFVKKEMGECILGYITRLPGLYRATLVLSDLEELSNAEIAAILGVSLETVKMRLHRARAMLRDEFLSHCEYYWLSELSWQAS